MKYLIQQKLVHDDNINAVITYLKAVNNILSQIVEIQTRKVNENEPKENDRNNKARGSFYYIN